MASLDIYNLLNSHAAAAEFWYVDRLQSEIGAYPDGRADIQEHPRWSRSWRALSYPRALDIDDKRQSAGAHRPASVTTRATRDPVQVVRTDQRMWRLVRE
jgi:hypothetical protein